MNVLGFCFLLVFENLIHTYNNLIISTLHTPFSIPLKYHHHQIFLQNHVLFYKMFIQINWLVSFNSPSTINAAHMHMTIGLSTGAKVSLSPSAATTHFPYLHDRCFNWFDLTQVSYRQQQLRYLDD